MTASEDDPFARYESFGIRAPRITRIDGTYYITFLAESENGKRIGLARTNDFQSVERMHLVSEPDTKSGALFPREIAGPLMRLGAAVLDRSDPSCVIARSNIPILAPREKYERIGNFGNVVFASGAVIEPDGEAKVYYGASDTSICVATAHVDKLVESCFQSTDV